MNGVDVFVRGGEQRAAVKEQGRGVAQRIVFDQIITVERQAAERCGAGCRQDDMTVGKDVNRVDILVAGKLRAAVEEEGRGIAHGVVLDQIFVFERQAAECRVAGC